MYEEIYKGINVEQMTRDAINRAEKERREIAEERELFGWDLCVYKLSNEGKAFAAALASGNVDEIRKAAADYYGARNGAGVHYDDEQLRAQAMREDRAIAQYLHDLD